MSVILGIDPSLTNTGLCWGDGEEYFSERIGYKIPRSVRIREIDARMERVNYLTESVSYKMDDMTESDVDLVLIESYSFGSRNGGEYLGEYGGTLRLMLWHRVVNMLEVAPTMVKKFATGKGNAKKEVIIGHVQKRWNVLFENSDEADAYVLYRIGLCYAGICEPENKAQREVIEKLKS